MSRIKIHRELEHIQQVEEENTYRILLVNNDKEELNLYVVAVGTPAGIETVHVLASSMKRAVGQALCILHYERHRDDCPWPQEAITTSVKKVPFGMEGWSDRKF